MIVEIKNPTLDQVKRAEKLVPALNEIFLDNFNVVLENDDLYFYSGGEVVR